MEHEILLEKIGETRTDKLIQDCYKIYRESFDKEFPDYFDNSNSKLISIVSTSKPNDSEINHIGMSCINDLLMENWGKFLAGLMGGSAPNGQMKTTLGTSFGMTIHGGQGFNFYGNPTTANTGTYIQTGDDLIPPTRLDFTMSNIKNTLASSKGGWNSGLGQVSIAGQGVASSSYSISQTGLSSSWALTGQSVLQYLLAKDQINPVVPVVVTETINVNYLMVFN